MVGVDGGSLQPKSVGLVWGFAAGWRWVCIHHVPWWQHYKYGQGYYCYYKWKQFCVHHMAVDTVQRQCSVHCSESVIADTIPPWWTAWTVTADAGQHQCRQTWCSDRRWCRMANKPEWRLSHTPVQQQLRKPWHALADLVTQCRIILSNTIGTNSSGTKTSPRQMVSPSIFETITHHRNALLGHAARLPDDVPAHKALNCYINLSLGRPPSIVDVAEAAPIADRSIVSGEITTLHLQTSGGVLSTMVTAYRPSQLTWAVGCHHLHPPSLLHWRSPEKTPILLPVSVQSRC